MSVSEQINITSFPKQREFIECDSTYCAAVAGIGSGKSQAGAIKAFMKCVSNPGIQGTVTSPTYKVLKDATIPKYQEVFSQIPKYAAFLGGDDPQARLADGGLILFRSTEKPDNLRGPELGFFHMDEGAQSSFYSWQILQGRLRQRRTKEEFYPLQGWVTTTPFQLNWIYTEFALEPRDGYKLFQWGLRDNKFMPKEYYDRIEKNYTGKFREQELEGKFLMLQGDCLFDTGNLEFRLNHEAKPGKVLAPYVYQWKEPQVGVRYVGGADCSDEGGGGSNCLVILNWQTGEEVLEVYGDIASDTFSKLSDKWGREYNNAFLGVECNGTVGGYVISKMIDMGYPQLYKRESTSKFPKYGWYTSGGNRSQILEEYRIAVNHNQTAIYSREALMEMMVFVADATGSKYEHIQGKRDDRVMARAIAWEMRKSKAGLANHFIAVQRPMTTYAVALGGNNQWAKR